MHKFFHRTEFWEMRHVNGGLLRITKMIHFRKRLGFPPLRHQPQRTREKPFWPPQMDLRWKWTTRNHLDDLRKETKSEYDMNFGTSQCPATRKVQKKQTEKFPYPLLRFAGNFTEYIETSATRIPPPLRELYVMQAYVQNTSGGFAMDSTARFAPRRDGRRHIDPRV